MPTAVSQSSSPVSVRRLLFHPMGRSASGSAAVPPVSLSYLFHAYVLFPVGGVSLSEGGTSEDRDDAVSLRSWDSAVTSSPRSLVDTLVSELFDFGVLQNVSSDVSMRGDWRLSRGYVYYVPSVEGVRLYEEEDSGRLSMVGRFPFDRLSDDPVVSRAFVLEVPLRVEEAEEGGSRRYSCAHVGYVEFYNRREPLRIRSSYELVSRGPIRVGVLRPEIGAGAGFVFGMLSSVLLCGVGDGVAGMAPLLSYANRRIGSSSGGSGYAASYVLDASVMRGYGVGFCVGCGGSIPPRECADGDPSGAHRFYDFLRHSGAVDASPPGGSCPSWLRDVMRLRFSALCDDDDGVEGGSTASSSSCSSSSPPSVVG